MKRLMKSMLAMCVLVATLSAFVCTKNELLNNATFALNSLRSALPLIETLLPGAAGKFGPLIPIAEKIKAAVAASDATSAVEYLRQLLPVFGDIVEHDVHGLPVATQTKILAALALADIGFGFLANYYENHPALAATTRARVQGVDAIAEYAHKERWGVHYKGK